MVNHRVTSQSAFVFAPGHDYGYNRYVETISKSALKARMLEIFRWVEQTGEELIVTDNNRPVLKVVPLRVRRPAAETYGDLRGRVVYRADIMEPTEAEWSET